MERVLEEEVMDTVSEVESYSSMDHGSVCDAFVDRLVELGAEGKMLDLGTGPGNFPFEVVKRIEGSSVFGVDLAHHMISYANKQKKERGVGDAIEFGIMDVTDLGFEDGCFDCVFSNTILHHIPDPRGMLTEAVRVLKPGGVLVIRDLYRPSDEIGVEKLLARHAKDDTVEQRGLLGDSLRAALEPGELREMIDELGLEGIEVVVDSDRHVTLQRRKGFGV